MTKRVTYMLGLSRFPGNVNNATTAEGRTLGAAPSVERRALLFNKQCNETVFMDCTMLVYPLHVDTASLEVPAMTFSACRGQRTTLQHVPKRAEGGDSCFLAALHDFAVADVVGRDEDDLRVPAVECLLEDLHCVWTAAAQLAIPEEKALRAYVAVDESGDGGPECLFLVGADPDEEPVGALQARREGSSNAGTCANAHAAVIQCRRVRDTRELSVYQAPAYPVCIRRRTFSSRVHSVLGGSLTRLRVKSPCTPQIM